MKKSAVAALSDTDTPHGVTVHIHPSTSLLHYNSTLEQEELAFQRAISATDRYGDGSGDETADSLNAFLSLEGGDTDSSEFMFPCPFPFDNFENGPTASGADGRGFPVNYRAGPLGAEIHELPGSEISSLKSSIHSRSSRSSNDEFDVYHSDVEMELKLELDRDVRVTGNNWEQGATNNCVSKTHHEVSSEEPLLAESRRYFIPIPRTNSEDHFEDLFGIAHLNDGFPGENINDNGNGQHIHVHGPNEDVFDLNPVDHVAFAERVSSRFYGPPVPHTLAAAVSMCSSSKHRLVPRKKPRTVSIDQASIDMLFFSNDDQKKEDASAFDSLTSPRRKIRTAAYTKCDATATTTTTTRIVAPTPIRLHGYDHAHFNTNIRDLESGAEHQIDQPCSGIPTCELTNAAAGFQNIVYSEYHRMVHSIQSDSPVNRSTFAESALKSGDV